MKNTLFHLVLSVSAAQCVLAETITVDDDGPADFVTIQAAIDHAQNGDVILVSPGVYQGGLNTAQPVADFRGKSLTLISRDGAEETILDGLNQTTPVVIEQTTDPTEPIKIEGFTIRNGQQAGIRVFGDCEIKVGFSIIEDCREPGIWSAGIVDLTVAHCMIRNNDSTYLSGGILHDGGPLLLLNTTFMGNYSDTLGGAVRLWGSTNIIDPVDIIECTFINNAASQGAAISANDMILLIDRCQFENNTGGQGTAVFLQLNAVAEIRDSSFCAHSQDDIQGDWIDLGGNSFESTCEDLCIADLDGNGVVNGADLTIALAAWGICSDVDDCPADLNFDGAVNGADLTILLSEWGPC